MICLEEKCDVVITDTRNAWAEIKGFDQPRTAGGTNAVVMREKTGRYLCEDCMRRRRLKINRDQGSMF